LAGFLLFGVVIFKLLPSIGIALIVCVSIVVVVFTLVATAGAYMRLTSKKAESEDKGDVGV
jgi:hypothetical protein